MKKIYKLEITYTSGKSKEFWVESYDGTTHSAKYFLNLENAMNYLTEFTESSKYRWCECEEIETED